MNARRMERRSVGLEGNKSSELKEGEGEGKEGEAFVEAGKCGNRHVGGLWQVKGH